MGSSTSRITSPYLPDLPDNEREVREALNQYRRGLEMIRETAGIPGLMEQLTRINAAQQELATRSLSSALTGDLASMASRLDTPMLRSRPTASPSPQSRRDQGPSPSPSRPLSPLLPLGRKKGLGPIAAERIALAQVRAEARRADKEG